VRRVRALIVAAGILLGLALPTAALGATQIVVQGTTDTRDAGLVDDVIVPGFQKAYPQYTLQYIAVGTGQALTNAKAGQGDAVMTHAPSLEADFVAQGYSYEPVGRAVMYSDYVMAAHDADPAAVAAGARHDAVRALELIATAGLAGNAVFVSRGDNSGTNVQEQIIWGLTSGVPLHPVGTAGSGRMEPDGNGDGTGTDVPAWYKKAGVGQAATLKVAEQCNFAPAPATACYDLTDRGTFHRQISTGAVAGMKIVSDENDPNARGGTTLLLNPFSVYAVNPEKVPSVKLQGALAFLDYMTSPEFQSRLNSFPNAQQQAFFPDAFPLIAPTKRLPRSIRAGRRVTFAGTMTNQLPASPTLAGAPLAIDLSLGISSSPFGPLSAGCKTLRRGKTGADGAYRLTAAPTRNGALRVRTPRMGSLSPTTLTLGNVHVRGVARLTRVRRLGDGRVRVSGRLAPRAQGRRSRAVLLGRLIGAGATAAAPRLHVLKRQRLRRGQGRFSITKRLRTGRWKLRVSYVQPGITDKGNSRVRTVSVR
jgi:ABC-type tungstate transport system permease subunit